MDAFVQASVYGMACVQSAPPLAALAPASAMRSLWTHLDYLSILGHILEASWEHLGGMIGTSWKHLGASWRCLGASLMCLGASWMHLGGILEASGRHLGGILEASW